MWKKLQGRKGEQPVARIPYTFSILQGDLKGKVCTNQRPGIVLWSASQKTVYLIELTVPREDSVEEAYKRKKA